jgi:hypothetical protein
MKNKLILWLILLVVGFLLGFVPQYANQRRLEADLANLKQQLASCQMGAQLAQLRDAAAMTYFEATRMNYGTAAEYSSRFFSEAQQVAAQPGADPNLKAAMGELIGLRNPVAEDLARGDPAVLPKLQALFSKTEQATRR